MTLPTQDPINMAAYSAQWTHNETQAQHISKQANSDGNSFPKLTSELHFSPFRSFPIFSEFPKHW